MNTLHDYRLRFSQLVLNNPEYTFLFRNINGKLYVNARTDWDNAKPSWGFLRKIVLEYFPDAVCTSGNSFDQIFRINKETLKDLPKNDSIPSSNRISNSINTYSFNWFDDVEWQNII